MTHLKLDRILALGAEASGRSSSSIRCGKSRSFMWPVIADLRRMPTVCSASRRNERLFSFLVACKKLLTVHPLHLLGKYKSEELPALLQCSDCMSLRANMSSGPERETRAFLRSSDLGRASHMRQSRGAL